MKRKKGSKNSKIIIRVAGVLFGSVIVLVSALIINVDTFSWFTSTVESEMSVTAAKREDIIETIEILQENNNFTGIKLKKASELNHNPIVYFEVKGEAASYILHINPVKLDENKEYTVSIDPNINFAQHLKLFSVPIWKWDSNPIEGTVRIKYLNEYIDEEYDIQLSRYYLHEKYWEDIERQGVSFRKEANVEEARGEIVKLVTNIASYVDWEDNSTMNDSQSRSLVNSSNDKELSTASTIAITPISRLMFSSEQEKIIDVVAPRLLSHIKNLYDNLEELTGLLTEKLEEIAELTLKTEEQETNILALEEEKMLLEGSVVEMTSKNEELQNQNSELTESVDLLNNKITSLEELNSKLERQKSSLSDENSSLSSSNTKLIEENELLKNEIEELQMIIDGLMTSDDDDKSVSEDVYGSD